MKRAIQSLANALGYEVHKESIYTPANRLAMMQRLGINLVVDVGANDGQYGSEMRDLGYEGRIWSYEPLADAYARLRTNVGSDPLWKITNSGCGATTGSAVINVSHNSASSSLLPILETHTSSAPESQYVSQETISIVSLDDSVLPDLQPSDKIWLKIDTQGYEPEVLRGAPNLLPKVTVVECELSLVPLYEGQLLIDEMLSIFYKSGFRLIGVAPVPVFRDSETGYALQLDGTFLKM